MFDHSRPLSWIESQKMGAFLGVAKGSVEVPWLLELRLNMADQDQGEEEKGGKDQDNKPVLLVGKGTRGEGKIRTISPSC